MRSTLKLLGCDIVSENGVETIVPPTYRPDLEGEADISEEIARFYGYNRIVPTLLSGKQTTLGGRTTQQQLVEKICNTLVYNGFYEAITYSLSHLQIWTACWFQGQSAEKTAEDYQSFGR